MSSDTFSLDTSGMETVIADIKDIATVMGNLKKSMQQHYGLVAENWDGYAANTYRAKFLMLFQRCRDLESETYSMYERLLESYNMYRNADIQLRRNG